MPRIIEENIWAGSEASLQVVLDAQEAMATRLAAGDWGDDDEEEEASRLLEVHDGVGLLTIKGSLVNSSSWLNQYFGVTGYPEIREALVQAANNPDIQEILLDIDSGGGSVAGVSDTASLIRMINDQVKPVTAYTSGTMASAAYWLGSSAGQVYADRMAITGSIGVIATHMERSKMLKEAGIGVTVVRSGKYKALANGVEPLSEEGKKQLQAQVDAAAAVFDEHVATMRSRSLDYVREHMSQGREFVSEDAQRVGLIDGVKTFDALMSELKKSIDASKKSMDNRGNAVRGFGAAIDRAEHGEQQMGRKALTEQEIAALAAGASLGADAAASEVENEVENEANVEAAAADEGVEAQAEAPEVAAAAQDVAKNDEALRLLKEQLKAAQDDLLEAKIEGRRAAEKATELEAVVGPMGKIVVKAINNIQVALGGSALDLSAMTPAALVAEHERMTEQFQSKFKAGGVAAVDAAQGEQPVAQVKPFHKARVNAVRFNK